MKEGIIVKLVNQLDSKIKFPNLKNGETGVQVGFDLSSKNLTTDVIKMAYRTKRNGLVIAIDPDPYNHDRLNEIIEDRGLKIKTVQKGTFSEKTSDKLVLGLRASHNKIERIQSEKSPNFSGREIEVELDTLDNILKAMNVEYSKIRHINITNNGAEYDTLLGMKDILKNCNNINLTIASGRPNKMGEINGKRDYELIMEFLNERGFTCKFLRMNESFWWGGVNQLLFKQRWIFNMERYGVVMASKGKRKIKFYQSFS